MGSNGEAGDSGATDPMSSWEVETSGSPQALEQSHGEQVDEYLQDITDDENSLSPASKKLLKSCAVSMPHPTLSKQLMKRDISVIARPTNMGLDFSGFSFAKPTQPASNFSCRSRQSRSSEAPRVASVEKDTHLIENTMRGEANMYSSVASGKPERENMSQASSQSLEPVSQLLEHVPTGTTSTAPNPSSSKKPSESSPSDSVPGQSPTPSTAKGSHTTDCQLHVRSGDHQDVTNNQPGTGSSLVDGTTEEQPNFRQVNSTTLPARRGNPGPLAVHSPPAQPPKVVKTQAKAKNKRHQLPRESGAPSRGSPSEPSEEDLFYLLIHRMRQREDSEAASAALKEELEAQICEMARVNGDLQIQLDQARTKSRNQEAEIDSHRGLINRWRIKLKKIRTFITGIGDDSECLRKEGQAIKFAQEALAGEKQVINDSLKHLHNNICRIEQHWSTHQAQFAEMRHDLEPLQQSLSMAQGKVAEGKKLLLQEKRRVSMLENFIRGHSTKQQQQVALLQQKQIETTNKLDVFFDHVQKYWNGSQNTLKCEVQPELGQCLELVKVLCGRDSVKPGDLESVQGTIDALTNRLDSHMMRSSADIQRELKLQNDQCSDLKSQFDNFGNILSSTVSTTEHLVQARELNGKLEEKLRTAEETLARATADCSKYMLAEEDLRDKVANLEASLATARKQLECATADPPQTEEERERVYQLEVRLNETSATLACEREALKAKENEMSCLRQELSGTKDSLESTMDRMTRIQTENIALQEQIRSVEYRVREELSRASLASRDQNRAWVEQQVHRLKQEKLTAENSAAQFQEQLAASKESLVRAERYKCAFDEQEAKITALSSQVSELDDIKKFSSQMEKELECFRKQHASNLQEITSLKQEIEAIKMEKEDFLSEIHELRERNVATETSEKLQEKMSLLEDHVLEKDNMVASLTKELENTRSRTEFMPALEHDIEEKIEEVASLKGQVEDANKRCTQSASICQKMTDDCIMLRKELSSAEQIRADLVDLQAKLELKEQESDALKGRMEEIDQWSRGAEDFLLKFKILHEKGSVFNNWDLIETKLRSFIEDQQHRTDATSDHQVVSSTRDTQNRPAHQVAKRDRTPKPSAFPEPQEQDGGFRQYFSHNKQESTSESPRKLLPHAQGAIPPDEQSRSSSSFIKPFSQIQSDIRTQVPSSSPDVSLSDLSSMFPSTPRSDNSCCGAKSKPAVFPEDPRALRSGRDSSGDIDKKAARNPSRRRKDSKEVKSGEAIDTSHKRKEKRGPVVNSHNTTSPNLKRKVSAENANLSVPVSYLPNDLHGGDSLSSPNSREPRRILPSKPPPNDFPSTSIQKSSRNLRPKGILKDTTSAAKDCQTERRGIEDTLLGGRDKAKTLRKTTSSKTPGTTSEYFSRTSSPKSGVNEDSGVFEMNRRSAQSLTYISREKRRRSSRGNRYNDRFSQGVTWAE